MQVQFSFSVSGYDSTKPPFEVLRFEGEEELSRLFRFVIQLASTYDAVELGDLVGMKATLEIKRDGVAGGRKFHGLVAEAAMIGKSYGEEVKYFYEVVLVPRVWLLTRSRGYTVYATDAKKKPYEVVEAVLTGPSMGDFSNGEDFERRNVTTDNYVDHDYLAQFDETPFDFISRLMEHVGLFYFFEQGDAAEKMVLSDRNEAFRDVGGEGTTRIQYRGDVPNAGDSPRSIQAFAGRRHLLPEKIVLTDYEYDLNDPVMRYEVSIALGTGPLSGGAQGKAGTVEYFGDYGKPAAYTPDSVKSPDDVGTMARKWINRLLKVRAEEVQCRQIVFEGRSDREDLYPGGHFQLDGHFRTIMNQVYLVTKVHHRGAAPTYGSASIGDGEATEAGYSNSFEAIHADVPFRAERRTPKPVFTGMMPAVVDAKSGVDKDERAHLDALGRYKVKLPFDAGVSGRKAGQASTYLRMSTLSAGTKQGMHFPLLPGSEVIWTCINGDVDRPVICGALPNRAAPSSVTWENRTQSRIDTPGGIQIVMNDGPGKKQAG